MANKVIELKIGEGAPDEITVGGKTGRIIRGICGMLPMLLLFALFTLGLVRLWQRGIESSVFKVRPSIFISNDGLYSPEALREFDRLSNTFSGVSLLKPGLLDEVRELYGSSPWIEEVCSLKRVYPNKINIEFIPRFTAAQLKHNGYYWLVAEDGVLLPADGVKKKYEDLPVICGDIEHRPENGQIWHGEGVGGALKALTALKDSEFGHELGIKKITIEAPGFIDKLQRPGRSRPRLIVDTGNNSNISVLWGACLENFPGEPDTAQKIQMLNKLLHDWKEKGELGRNVCFDVRTNVVGYNL